MRLSSTATCILLHSQASADLSHRYGSETTSAHKYCAHEVARGIIFLQRHVALSMIAKHASSVHPLRVPVPRGRLTSCAFVARSCYRRTVLQGLALSVAAANVPHLQVCGLYSADITWYKSNLIKLRTSASNMWPALAAPSNTRPSICCQRRSL